MYLSVDEKDNRPIYTQIIRQIKEQINSGVLKPGDELPSVREVADSLGINMHTVRSAYLKLQDQGIIVLHLGRRARIARCLPPQKHADYETAIQVRLKEIITDALLAGIQVADLRKLLNQQLDEIK
jgi:GntR family transcriptional regulator